jgi:hypothetical protein
MKIKFIQVSLEENEETSCPDPNCTFNTSKIRRGLTASALFEGEELHSIHVVYCPYCCQHLQITKAIDLSHVAIEDDPSPLLKYFYTDLMRGIERWEKEGRPAPKESACIDTNIFKRGYSDEERMRAFADEFSKHAGQIAGHARLHGQKCHFYGGRKTSTITIELLPTT